MPQSQRSLMGSFFAGPPAPPPIPPPPPPPASGSGSVISLAPVSFLAPPAEALPHHRPGPVSINFLTSMNYTNYCVSPFRCIGEPFLLALLHLCLSVVLFFYHHHHHHHHHHHLSMVLPF